MTAESLDSALGPAVRVLLDTSALIAYHSRAELAHPLAKHLLSRIEDRDDPLQGYFSVVTASELLVRPYRAGMAEFTIMRTFLTAFPNLEALTTGLEAAIQAATIRATAGLRLPDAIIVANGLLAGCEAVITNDGEWKRKLAPLFKDFLWIYLGDYL